MNATRKAATPRVGVALGGGGARGFAHIVALEILDELGVTPVALAGCSMGAIVGAAYAAGMSGKALRAYTLGLMRDRARVMATALQARAARGQWFSGFANPVLIDGERFLDLFWPDGVPGAFEDLKIPFAVVATDYYARAPIIFERGPLTTAVAGSMAIPGLVKPVEAGSLALIDGGAVDPLPYDLLLDRCDVVIACDVIGGPVAERRGAPTAFEATLGAAQIMQASIVRAKLAAKPPHVLLRPPVDVFRALDFFRATQIFKACDEKRDEMKRAIVDALTVSTKRKT